MRSLCLVCLLAMLASILTLAQTNPVPLINQPLVPDAAVPGGKGFTLTVNGTGFVSASVVNWNGSARATTFVSSSQLTASILASDIKKAGTASLTVVSPGPGGGVSNRVFFPITLPTNIVMNRSDYGVGSHPNSVSTADLRGSGKLDLVLANGNDGTISVLLGNGDGTFQPQVTYPVGNSPGYVAIADFNRDGKPDLAVTNVGSNTVSVLLGNGDGTFQPQVPYATGKGSWGIATADVNQDGKLDLLVTNSGDTTISVLLGNGDGTFQTHVDYQAGAVPTSVAVGDFNGNGKLDLAVADFSNSNTVTILVGNGDGTFTTQSSYPVGSLPEFVAAADFNGDGKLDLVVANQASSTVSVLLGNGDGTFQPQVTYPVSCVPTSILAADLNGDGKLDIAVPDYCDSGGTTVSVLPGNGDGTFQAHMDFPVGTAPNQVEVGDFNGDGRLDLATADQSSNQLSVLLQIGTVSLSPPSVNFGVQLIRTKSAAQKVVLTNVGTAALNISSITVTGTDAGDFSEHNNCPPSLPAKAHCAINVTFKPSDFGPRTAALSITDDAPGSPQSVPLSGIGVHSGPNATLSTKSLTFATQVVGTTSPPQPVTLSDYGTETLSISSIVASGDYSETDNCGSSVPPGGYCTINVTFTPTKKGPRGGTVTITDNAPNSPQKVSLTGSGTVVKLDPSSLNFGAVPLGQQSAQQDTTLTNVGKTKLHVTSIAITGTDSGDFFIQQETCPNPGYLGGGKSCTITVVFKPTLFGSRTADVSVSDNGGGSPQQVSLSGIGLTNCSGPCGISCIKHHCGCRFQRCVPLSSAVVEETASRLTCSQTNPFTELR